MVRQIDRMLAETDLRAASRVGRGRAVGADDVDKRLEVVERAAATKARCLDLEVSRA